MGELLYNLLTTGYGMQSLGEEYCAIHQVTGEINDHREGNLKFRLACALAVSDGTFAIEMATWTLRVVQSGGALCHRSLIQTTDPRASHASKSETI